MRALTLCLSLALACSGGDTTDSGTSDDGGESGGDEGGESGGESGGEGEEGGDGGGDTGPLSPDDIPEDPSPFTLSVSGAYNGDLLFDSPSCTWPYGSSNFRVFWRNSSGAHVFVLVAELLGTFEGPGTYNETDHSARVRLQEEAGGSASYYAVDSAQGDRASITVDFAEYDDLKDEGIAWGEFTVEGMHDSSGGLIEVSPTTVQIWCPTVN
jgi:hypothetical protein